jgi:hypothetical protein
MKVHTSYMVTFIIAALICSIMLTVLYSTCRLEIHLFWKDHFGKLENGNSGRCMFERKTPCTMPVHRIHKLNYIEGSVFLCVCTSYQYSY